jgi:hypothetical protein
LAIVRLPSFELNGSRWLNIIQRGGTEDWRELYRTCRGDRAVAEAVARSLAWRDPDLLASAHLWAFLLDDLWPDLRIDLREDRLFSAV